MAGLHKNLSSVDHQMEVVVLIPCVATGTKFVSLIGKHGVVPAGLT